MELKKKGEIRELQNQEAEMVSGEVQSVTEANEIVDQIMSLEMDAEKKYAGSAAKEISFGSTVSTS